MLILTARGQLSERIRGLDAGADDYLVKPFQFDELLARVRAVIRRAQGRVVPAMSYGAATLDPTKRLVTRAGERISLSAHEYRTLLALLALLERPGHVVTRDQLELLGWQPRPVTSTLIDCARSLISKRAIRGNQPG